MELNEVKEYLNTNKDIEDVKSYIGGLNPMTADRTNEFLNTEDGKRLLQPKLDTYMNKGVESWKTNNLAGLVDAEVKKRFPTLDPKDKALADLSAQFEDMKNSTAKEKLTNKTLKQFQELKLPSELVDFIVGDEASTAKNIDIIKAIFSTRDEAIKTELVKGNSYTPPTGGSAGNMDKLREKIRKNMG